MTKLLTICGMWCLTDGWFSMSLYWGKLAGDRQQTFWRDHYIRVLRMIIGVILIVLGALPFLLKIEKISAVFLGNKVLSFLAPGEIVYQIVIIILGILLVWKVRSQFDY